MSTSKKKLAHSLLETFRSLKAKRTPIPSCFIGFDGFSDEIIDAVERRDGPSTYTAMKKMAQFGQRILDFSGKSCNIELVVRERKIGGNAPILANALLKGGHHLTFCGAIGEDETEPLFQEMAQQCEHVYLLSASGHTDAVEFHDGKIILGKHNPLFAIDYVRILDVVGKQSLIDHLNTATLFVSANWTMLPHMTDIWRSIKSDICPHLKEEEERILFVDLADPAKRGDKAIAEALIALKELQPTFQVVLGLNEAEAERIGAILNIASHSNYPLFAEEILKASSFAQVIIHTTKFAAGSSRDEKSVKVEGPYTPEPVLTTGAGDNFNAGFCNALLYGCSLEESLLSGVATSGFYVRNGRSPSIPELAQFLKTWENGAV